MKIKIILALSGFLFLKSGIHIKEFPIVTPERLKLTREYCIRHYGLNTCEIKKPEMIVIHYTAIGTLKGSLDCFKPDAVSGSRNYIKRFGRVNVGVHFVVDLNGDIYSLLPLDIIGRHVIGFNHVSLGIENVGRHAGELTAKQLESNAVLVKYLLGKFPGIKYLIGHHEYSDRKLPHYRLYSAMDPGYRPLKKIDPGKAFIKDLRKMLKEKYSIELLD